MELDLMTEFNQVQLTLQSDQDGEQSTTQFIGQAFQKGSSLYIRYTESADTLQQEVRTVVKIDDHEVKIMRRGAVESDQTFRQEERLPGSYRSPFATFTLLTHTRQLTQVLDGHLGRVNWEYELYVHEELTGTFKISLHIQALDTHEVAEM